MCVCGWEGSGEVLSPSHPLGLLLPESGLLYLLLTGKTAPAYVH